MDPRITIVNTYESMSEVAAKRYYIPCIKAHQSRSRRGGVIVHMWGNTPKVMDEIVADEYRRGDFSTKFITFVKPDELCGVPMGDAYLMGNVIKPLDIALSRYVGFNSRPYDYIDECLRMDSVMAGLGSPDLTLLGFGAETGHALLWESQSVEHPPYSHVAKLCKETKKSLLLPAGTHVDFGLSLGVKHVTSSKLIVMLVSGEGKAAKLKEALEGPISPQCSASYIRLGAWRVIADRAAASLLTR